MVVKLAAPPPGFYTAGLGTCVRRVVHGVETSFSRKLTQPGPDPLLSHCPRCVHAGVGETLEIILTHRLYLGRSGPNAAEHRIDAQAGGGLAKKQTDGRHSIYEAFIEGKLEAPKHLARTVHDLYFEPKYEEFRPRTIWSLSNVFTSAFKDLDPIPQFKATAKLGEFLEARFSQSF